MSAAPRPLEPDGFDRWARFEPVMFGAPARGPATLALREVVDPARTLVVDDGDAIAATVTSFPMRLTLPGGVRPTVAAVSCVGVLPTHRRRGLGSAVLVEQLRAVRDAGEPAAVLNASEATIYGRFGYGVSTWFREVTIATSRSAFRPEVRVAEGTMRWMCPDDGPDDALSGAYERAAAGLPGELSRSPEWWRLALSAEPSWFAGGRGHQLVLHESSSGVVDGYVHYRVDRGGRTSLIVRELIAANARVEAALWRFVLDHDLIDEVVAPLPERSGLPLWLVDLRAADTGHHGDYLWVRPLDVSELLSGRASAALDSLVLEVVDEVLPEVGGRFRCTAAGGELQVEASTDDPDLVVAVAQVGEAVLGAPRFRSRHASGLLDGTFDAAARADAMFEGWPRPWCWTRF